MAKNVLLIALVLSKWLIADTKIEKPLFAELLSDGQACSDWPVGTLFPDFCAFALYRCILKKYFLQRFRCPGVIIKRTVTRTTTQETTTLPMVLNAVMASSGGKQSVSLELSHPNTTMTTTEKTSGASVTPTEETSNEEAATITNEETSEEVVTTTATEHVQEHVSHPTTTSLPMVLNAVVASSGGKESVSLELSHPNTTMTTTKKTHPTTTTLPMVLNAVVASSGGKESVSLELSHPNTTMTTTEKTSGASVTPAEETSNEEAATNEETSEEAVTTTATEHVQEHVSHPTTTSLPMVLNAVVASSGGKESVSLELSHPNTTMTTTKKTHPTTTTLPMVLNAVVASSGGKESVSLELSHPNTTNTTTVKTSGASVTPAEETSNEEPTTITNEETSEEAVTTTATEHVQEHEPHPTTSSLPMVLNAVVASSGDKQSVSLKLSHPNTTMTTTKKTHPTTTTLPMVLNAVVASSGGKESVSLELSHPNTTKTTTVKTSGASVTPAEETSNEESATIINEETSEEAATTTATEHPQEHVPHPTTTTLPMVLNAVVASSGGKESVSLELSHPNTTTEKTSTTTKSPFEPIAGGRSVGAFSRFFTLFVPITTNSPPLGSSPNEHENHPNLPKQKFIAGHVEAKVSLVTLNAEPPTGTPNEHLDLLTDNNTDLFARLQDNEVQRLIQQTQGLLAKGKGKELQATSLQLLKALNLANAQNAANFGINSQQQISNWAQP